MGCAGRPGARPVSFEDLPGRFCSAAAIAACHVPTLRLVGRD